MSKVKDISSAEASKEKQRRKNRGAKVAKELATNFESKTFANLTRGEKDDLLKTIALRLHLILPD